MTDLTRVNGSPRRDCGLPLHKRCTCVRPLDHEGDHNCVYRDGRAVVDHDPRPKQPIKVPRPAVQLDEPNTPDRAFLAIAIAIFLTVLVMAAIGIWVDATGGG